MELVIFLIFFFVSVVPAILQWLWNTTIPDIFRLPKITYWQALRLLLIASMLFGQGAALNYKP
ncbi:MAG: hypothetical protein HC857_11880 [Synechococcales cyanobacterium RU_4_20]|nr:hypothetical protein [Synechococcales cyanobacterium RU_4_20]NJR68594.1 hypothetical protein [Synechococcales cyanobacterium CRU_2_2]